jgi:DNA-binding NarL/FixJ family response regulator
MGLAMMLESEDDMKVVAQASSGEEAVVKYKQALPDITLMDLRLQGMNGVDATTAILSEYPRAKVIMLTTYDRDEDVYRSLRAGVMSFLVKDTPAEELLETIRKVYQGRRHITAPISEKLAQRMSRSDLTEREVEILQLMAKGLSNKEIGQALSLSLGTVKFHITNVLAKLDASDRTQAVIAAIRLGLADV